MAKENYTTMRVTKMALAGFKALAERDKRTAIAEFEWLVGEELKRRVPVVGKVVDGKVVIENEQR